MERLGGTYEMSWTWFEVAILTPNGHDRVTRRLFQRNVNARTEFRKHEVMSPMKLHTYSRTSTVHKFVASDNKVSLDISCCKSYQTKKTQEYSFVVCYLMSGVLCYDEK